MSALRIVLMNITYACRRCERTTRADFDEATANFTCVCCGHDSTMPPHAVAGEQIKRCLVCPSTELFVRKNFPQQLGVTIVVIGLVASCVPWYFHQWYATFAILFGTALIDVVLYLTTGSLLQCYRCHAQYRGVAGLDTHLPFNLEIHEKHRQQLARLAQNATRAADEHTIGQSVP